MTRKANQATIDPMSALVLFADGLGSTEPVKVGRADYESRKAARIERLGRSETKARKEGESRVKSARQIASMIPFGQPILVGHHSEKRHRRDAQRIRDGFAKGFELTQKADHYANRAAAAESNDAISSDDPLCLDKLRAKLGAMQARLSDLREGKKAYRKAATDDDRKAIRTHLGVPSASFYDNRESWADYVITNLAGNARRVAIRIETIERRAAQVAKLEATGPKTFGEIEIRTQDNRTQILFPGKPSAAVRSELKASGFRWAPSVEAWQRMASNGAQYQAERIVAAIAAGTLV
jgi:hypothetical protein